MSLNKFAYELGQEAALNAVGITKQAMGIGAVGESIAARGGHHLDQLAAHLEPVFQELGMDRGAKIRLLEALGGGTAGGAAGYATGDDSSLLGLRPSTRGSHAAAGAGAGALGAMGLGGLYRSPIGQRGAAAVGDHAAAAKKYIDDLYERGTNAAADYIRPGAGA
jgi:hypothetical protein